MHGVTVHLQLSCHRKSVAGSRRAQVASAQPDAAAARAIGNAAAVKQKLQNKLAAEPSGTSPLQLFAHVCVCLSVRLA